MNQSDKNFRQLIQNQKKVSPSPKFSIKVMNKIYQLNHQFVYKPVIGKWTWRIIFTIFGIFVSYVLLDATPSGNNWNWSEKIINLFSLQKITVPQISSNSILSGIETFFQNIPLVLSLSIIALFLLLLIDQLFLKKNTSR